jgi:hypothetical protein
MTIKLRGKRDRMLARIADALTDYDNAHPKAQIEAYRQNPVSVRIRVLNPEFAGKSRAEREEEVWNHLNKLPEDAVADISLLLLLTPQEAKDSLVNLEFDDPTPSRL